jgi:predicted outer membrane lipoprotein
MITASYIALALFLGYTVAVGLSMATTFGITAASREFVEREHRIRRGYKYAQDGMWLVCSAAGGYVASLINGPAHAWVVGTALAGILIAVLWMNAWEMRQRGVGHQMAMSLAAGVGVAAGFMLHLR